VVAANNAFAAAEALAWTDSTWYYTQADTAGATLEPGEPTTEDGPFYDDEDEPYIPQVSGSLWYTVTAPKTGEVGVYTQENSNSVIVGVYTGTAVASLTRVIAGQTSAVWPVTAGATYHVRICPQVAWPLPAPGTVQVQFFPSPAAAPPPATATDTSDLAGGRTRVGTAEDWTAYPVPPRPPRFSIDPVRVLAEQMPAPTLRDGRPA
jgi:hypothetical protein